MDDAGARPPEAHAVLGGGGAQEVIDFAVLAQGFLQVLGSLNPGLDEVVAVDGGGHGGGAAHGLHKLEHGGLAQHVLEDDPVGAELDVGLTAHQAGLGRVVEVGQEYLVGQYQGPIVLVLPDRGQVAVQPLVNFGNQLSSRCNRRHNRFSPT